MARLVAYAIALALSVPSLSLAGSLETNSLGACVRTVLKKLVPGADLEQPAVTINNSVKRFIQSVETDHSIRSAPPLKQGDHHFEKHRTEFARIGIPLNSERDYHASAIEFAASQGKNRIVFAGKNDTHIYKVDLNDGRVLIMSGSREHRMITYFIVDLKQFGMSSIEEYAFRRLYLGEGRAGNPTLPH